MRLICTIIFFYLFSTDAWAQGGTFSLRNVRVGIDYSLYTGTRGSSFAGSQGLGLSASTYSGFSLLGVSTRFRLSYGYGSIILGSTSASQTHINTELGLGMKLNLIPTKSPPFNPYIGAHGLMGLLFLSLPSNISNSVSGASASNSGLGFGYEIFAGVDLSVSGGKKSIFVEAILRNISHSIAGQSSYSAGGLTLTGGLVLHF